MTAREKLAAVERATAECKHRLAKRVRKPTGTALSVLGSTWPASPPWRPQHSRNCNKLSTTRWPTDAGYDEA